MTAKQLKTLLVLGAVFAWFDAKGLADCQCFCDYEICIEGMQGGHFFKFDSGCYYMFETYLGLGTIGNGSQGNQYREYYGQRVCAPATSGGVANCGTPIPGSQYKQF